MLLESLQQKELLVQHEMVMCPCICTSQCLAWFHSKVLQVLLRGKRGREQRGGDWDSDCADGRMRYGCLLPALHALSF
jgi:hypothetical protein